MYMQASACPIRKRSIRRRREVQCDGSYVRVVVLERDADIRERIARVRDNEGHLELCRSQCGGRTTSDHILGLGTENRGRLEELEVIVAEVLDGLRKAQCVLSNEVHGNHRCAVVAGTFCDRTADYCTERSPGFFLDITDF
jgi:hypothetical protein